MSPAAASTLFLAKPKVLYVDTDYSVKPPDYGTIVKLIQSLKNNGPLVVEGKMGPRAYTADPFKLKDKIENEDVYGWPPGKFKENATSVPVILLGAKQTESNAYVYFTLAEDITKSKESLIRGFRPLEQDTNVYIMSYENFLKRSLFNLHPICPHGQWLFSVDVNAILDRGPTEKKCKELGQAIFDHYKTAAQGNSKAGEEAVIRICNAAKFLTSDGLVRKAHIERAWDGVGDDQWRWRA